MSEESATHYGFKRLTQFNWKAIDSIIQFPSPVPEEVWVEACLKPQLESGVPESVRAIFEVARGSMLYGWFFYPLLTLASEQLHRVQEAGAREKCRQLVLVPPVRSKKGEMIEPKFSHVLDALKRHGVIDSRQDIRWQAGRSLRNWSSHPQRQSIYSAGMALGALTATTELVNALFCQPSTISSSTPLT